MFFTYQNMTFIKITTLAFITFVLPASIFAQTIVDFEALPIPTAGFFNGDTNAASPFRDNFTITGTGTNFGQTEFLQTWETDGVNFFNSYTPAFGSWNGFSWSTITDATTVGFGNQYASFAGGGSDGAGGTSIDGTYAIGFGNRSFFNLPENAILESVDVTNTTYAGISMRDGDAFAKKFGGVSGDDEDFFSVTFTGYDQTDMQGNTISSFEYFLSDFRFDDNSQDYILSNWQNVDLSALGNARSVGLTFTTTDVGTFGANTPLYAAFDNLTFEVTAVPEPVNLMAFSFGLALFTLKRRRS